MSKVVQNKLWRQHIDARLDKMNSRQLYQLLDIMESMPPEPVDADLDTEVQEKMGENPTLTASEIRRELGQ